uniref:Uncharacterized protein n=1 Tax=Anguilla anguilla TaxID=7936 RepID=A0A0E9SAW3_ANGAN
MICRSIPLHISDPALLCTRFKYGSFNSPSICDSQRLIHGTQVGAEQITNQQRQQKTTFPRTLQSLSTLLHF